MPTDDISPVDYLRVAACSRDSFMHTVWRVAAEGLGYKQDECARASANSPRRGPDATCIARYGSEGHTAGAGQGPPPAARQRPAHRGETAAVEGGAAGPSQANGGGGSAGGRALGVTEGAARRVRLSHRYSKVDARTRRSNC